MIAVFQEPDSSHEKISNQLDAMMDELMSPNLTRLVSSNAWAPECNIYEVKQEYLICVNLAGMHHDKIDVHVADRRVCVSGYREKPEWPDSREAPSVHVMEIDWGPFERSIELPGEVDASRVAASYRNGFLWVTVPKRASD